MGRGDTNIYYNMVDKARTAFRLDNCRCSCAKIGLVIINIIVLMCGLTAIGLRLWLHFEKTQLDNILHEIEFTYTETSLVYKYVWYTLYLAIFIAVGIYIILAGIFGIVFAFEQSQRFYIMTMIASIFSCVLCLVIGICLPVVAQQNPYNEITLVYRHMQKWDYFDNSDPFWAMVDLQQSKYQCCGVTGYGDYSVIEFYKKYAIPYPHSCCLLNSDVEPSTNVEETNVNWGACLQPPRAALYKEGCGDKLKVESPRGFVLLQYIYGTALGVAVLVILSIIFAVILYINPT